MRGSTRNSAAKNRHCERSIGTEIINRLIEKAKQDGGPVTLGVVKTNPAGRLYERLGFRVSHEDDRKFYMRRETVTAG
jgi:ribosomal protein S18 acetylase RimI-like enzyme